MRKLGEGDGAKPVSRNEISPRWSVAWKTYHHMALPAMPPHEQSRITEFDAKIALKQTGALLARWISNWDKGDESSWWFCVKTAYQGSGEFTSKTRNQCRKGLSNLLVKIVGPEVIRDRGYRVYAGAFEHYRNTYVPLMTEEQFRKHVNFSEDWGGIEYWGIFRRDNNELVGYSRNIVDEGTCEMVTTKFDPAYLKLRPSEALMHSMIEHYFGLEGFRYINDGARSIGHQSNIQDFLIRKFNFRKAYCDLHIVYAPHCRILVEALFPFRKFFLSSPIRSLRKLGVLLKQEELRRNRSVG